MAGRYKSYQEYKDSGVEWLDEIPANWTNISIRWASKLYAGGTPSKNVESYWENGTVPWLNSGAVNQRIVTEPSALITEAALRNSSAKWIPKGSLVVALAGQGKTKGMVASLAIRTTCNQSMAAVVPSGPLSSRYLFWWLDSNYQNIRNMSGGDHRDGLNLELLGNIQCPVPPLPEQTQIARFLDHETAKIDLLIEKQQALVALLKEKRQAVISHAVTKGLNTDAPMKDSGVKWLGEVPEHWEVKLLKYLGKAIIGLTYGPADIVEEGKGTLVLRSSNVQNGQIVFDNNVYVSSEISEKLITRAGDILICSRNGSRALIGKNAIINDCSQGLTFGAFMTIYRSPDNAYIECVLNSPLFEFQAGAFMTSTINQLTIGALNNFEIPFPPEAEREAIADYIAEETHKLDALTAEAERAINLLQERRTALISAAVTGKIDVCDWGPAETKEEYVSNVGI